MEMVVLCEKCNPREVFNGRVVGPAFRNVFAEMPIENTSRNETFKMSKKEFTRMESFLKYFFGKIFEINNFLGRAKNVFGEMAAKNNH